MVLNDCIALPVKEKHAKYLQAHFFNDCYVTHGILFFRVTSKKNALASVYLAHLPGNFPYGRFPVTSWYCRIDESLFPRPMITR